MEEEKKYCFECHNSVYRPSTMTRNTNLRNGNICLYCYKRKRYIPPYQLAGICRLYIGESADKLLRGVWGANQSGMSKPN